MTYRLKIAAAVALVTALAAAGGMAQESGPGSGMMGHGMMGQGGTTAPGRMMGPGGMMGQGGMMGRMEWAQMSRMMEGCHGMMLSMMQSMMGGRGSAPAPQPAPVPEKKG